MSIKNKNGQRVANLATQNYWHTLPHFLNFIDLFNFLSSGVNSFYILNYKRQFTQNF